MKKREKVLKSLKKRQTLRKRKICFCQEETIDFLTLLWYIKQS